MAGLSYTYRAYHLGNVTWCLQWLLLVDHQKLWKSSYRVKRWKVVSTINRAISISFKINWLVIHRNGPHNLFLKCHSLLGSSQTSHTDEDMRTRQQSVQALTCSLCPNTNWHPAPPTSLQPCSRSDAGASHHNPVQAHIWLFHCRLSPDRLNEDFFFFIWSD